MVAALTVRRNPVQTIEIRLEKVSERKLNPEKAKTQIKLIKEGVTKLAPRWGVEAFFNEKPKTNHVGNYVYRGRLQLTNAIASDTGAGLVKSKLSGEIHHIVGKERWTAQTMWDDKPMFVHKLDSKSANLESAIIFGGNKAIPDLNSDALDMYFSRIYGREAHIRLIYDSLRMAHQTGYKTRHHVLLRGLPACAKTELYLCFKEWLGDRIVSSLDATTMTKAGFEKHLLDRANNGTLTPVLIIEEIEKVDPVNIYALLQVMDTRGRISRTNARIGSVTAKCPIVVWATCNDENALRKVADGAIFSRFSLKPICGRPDREMMEKILVREVEEINGKIEWVTPVIDFLFDDLKDHDKDYNDPRLARALLAGGDRLLDGTFIDDYRKVHGIPNPKVA